MNWVNQADPLQIIAVLFLLTIVFRAVANTTSIPIETCPKCGETTIFNKNVCIMCGEKKRKA